MRKLIVATLLIALGMSVTASAITVNQWKNKNVSSAAAALAVVRSGAAPDKTFQFTTLQWVNPALSDDSYYVAYVTGFLTPPADGDYTFYCASDDNSSFALSPDADITKAVQICSVSGYVSANVWTTQATQKSAVKTLKAGQAYAFYFVMNEGTGGDNGSVGWAGPDPIGSTITVIDGQYVTDTNPAQPDAVTFAPVSGATTLLGAAATLNTPSAAMYPWNFTYEMYKVDPAGDIKVGTLAGITFAAVADANEGAYYCKSGSAQSDKAILDVTHGLVHRYTFNEADRDGVMIFDVLNQTGDHAGAFDGLFYDLSGKDKFENGKLILGNSGQTSNAGTGSYVDLPNGLLTTNIMTQFTIEAWVTPMGTQNWQRVFDFGTSDGGEDKAPGATNTGYIFLASRTSGTNAYARVGYKKPAIYTNPTDTTPAVAAVERTVNPNPSGRQLPLNQEVLLTVVWDQVSGLAKFYINGIAVGRNTLHMKLSNLTDNNNWLGRSQYNDPMFVGAYNEFRIWDTALAPADIARHAMVGPDDLSNAPAAGCTASGQRWQSDLNGDCVVDLIDYAMMVEQWMLDVTALAP